MIRLIRPLPATKKYISEYIAFLSADAKTWIVCGYYCAALVPRSIRKTRKGAIRYALKRPKLWEK
jgi:hypothetical protein